MLCRKTQENQYWENCSAHSENRAKYYSFFPCKQDPTRKGSLDCPIESKDYKEYRNKVSGLDFCSKGGIFPQQLNIYHNHATGEYKCMICSLCRFPEGLSGAVPM